MCRYVAWIVNGGQCGWHGYFSGKTISLALGYWARLAALRSVSKSLVNASHLRVWVGRFELGQGRGHEAKQKERGELAKQKAEISAVLVILNGESSQNMMQPYPQMTIYRKMLGWPNDILNGGFLRDEDGLVVELLDKHAVVDSHLNMLWYETWLSVIDSAW